MPAAIASGMLALCGCETVVDERIPNMAVSIDLSQAGQWQTWGVAAVGQANYFVYQPGSERLPSGFPYKRSSATGFGGVLLVMGMDLVAGVEIPRYPCGRRSGIARSCLPRLPLSL